MKKITLTSKGVVNIYASALSKGTYNYTLSIEGKPQINIIVKKTKLLL